jgi:hypothetical protein
VRSNAGISQVTIMLSVFRERQDACPAVYGPE